MLMRWLLAAVHLLALAIGFAAIWTRARALRSVPVDRAALSRAFAADVWWGVAAALWFVTGVVRALGTYERGTDYYLGNPLFHTKLTLFVVIVALEMWPMVTLVKWRKQLRRGETPDTARAGKIARISVAQAHILVIMVLLATALARGIGAR